MSFEVNTQAKLVTIAGIGIGTGSEVLRTLLGSCIGVALFEKSESVVGLAHIMLPNSNGKKDMLGKYADTAIPETIRQMQCKCKKKSMELYAKIVGGANMFASINPDPKNPIGVQNLLAVQKTLAELGIMIVSHDVGGEFGRRMLVHASSAKVLVYALNREPVEL